MEEVNVTWRFAWSLWWRMMLITLGLYSVIGIIAFIIALIVGVALVPFLSGF